MRTSTESEGGNAKKRTAFGRWAVFAALFISESTCERKEKDGNGE